MPFSSLFLSLYNCFTCKTVFLQIILHTSNVLLSDNPPKRFTFTISSFVKHASLFGLRIVCFATLSRRHGRGYAIPSFLTRQHASDAVRSAHAVQRIEYTQPRHTAGSRTHVVEFSSKRSSTSLIQLRRVSVYL